MARNQTQNNDSKVLIAPTNSKYPYPEIDNEYVRTDKFPLGGYEENQYQYYASEPKVSFFIPLAEGETKGATASPQVNGLRINIRKGVMVQIPKSLGDHMAESLNMTVEATESPTVTNAITGETKNARLDRQSEKDVAALS
jgi:hypothetical protein